MPIKNQGPREKLLTNPPSRLDTEELISIILGTGAKGSKVDRRQGFPGPTSIGEKEDFWLTRRFTGLPDQASVTWKVVFLSNLRIEVIT